MRRRDFLVHTAIGSMARLLSRADTVPLPPALTVAGGTPDTNPGSFPSWYPSTAGSVVALSSGTTIESAANANGAASYPGSSPALLSVAWCGGALVYVNTLPHLVVYGGGHTDGGYNGILKFGPLSGTGSGSPSWTVFLAASPTSALRNSGTYSDGRQAAVHTYNNLVGVGDTLYSMATDAHYNDGGLTDEAFKFTTAGQTALAQNNVRITAYGKALYYAGKIYWCGGFSSFDNVSIYDVAGNSWTRGGGADFAFDNYVGGAIDTKRGAMLMVGKNQGVYWPRLPTTSDRRAGIAAPSSYVSAVEYDPDRDAFVSCRSGSLTVDELSASALAAGSNPSWTPRTFSGTTPSAGEVNGTYGRFRYVPELKGYILAPTSKTSVYFYRSV